MKTRKLFEIELLGNERYLSNVKSYKINNKVIDREFELPNGIFNKVVPNCGGTTVALESGYKYVIASPRKELLYNKHKQNPDTTFLVVGGVSTDAIKEYINKADNPKILVTYDSIYKVVRAIGNDIPNWRLLVDEFQALLTDAIFRNDAVRNLVNDASKFDFVTYMSATPINDKFLNYIPELKNLDYYVINWSNTKKISVNATQTNKPINAACEIANQYKQGYFPTLTINGNDYTSTECVMYFNSVNNIVNIIKKCNLQPDDVNIIVGDDKNNIAKLAKLGTGYEIGHIPTKGESNKLITLCTSTAFCGVDFYSDCAATFVFSDCNLINTSIDITTELQQIAGRQRNTNNPFARFINFYYNVNRQEMTETEFLDMINEKIRLTKIECQNNNEITDAKLKQKRIEQVRMYQKATKYKDSYCYYDEQKQMFTLNHWAFTKDWYNWSVQTCQYKNGILVLQEINETSTLNAVSSPYVYFGEKINLTATTQNKVLQLQNYCKLRQRKEQASKAGQSLFTLNDTESQHPEFKYYYDQLGASKIKALKYREKDIINALAVTNKTNYIINDLQKMKLSGFYTNEQLKTMMQGLFDKWGLKGKAKATDFKRLKVYQFKDNQKRDNKHGILIY